MKNIINSTLSSQVLCCIVLLIIFTPSCKKFVEIGPPRTQITTETVFTNDVTAISAIRGIYSSMMDGGFAGGAGASITHLTGLGSDEFTNFTFELQAFAINSLVATNNIVKTDSWDPGYKFIYYANSMINGLASSTGLTESVKQQLLGEAKFIRAFCHFYLVNLYGDIPIATTTDYKINNTISRSPTTEVYQQIITDLTDAQHLLADDYSFSNGERVRPNAWAATALLARAYLYIGDWANAEAQATSVINNSTYNLVDNLEEVFLKNSSESVWQLKPVNPSHNTSEAKVFIPSKTENPERISLTDELVDAFEPGDARMTTWVGSYTAIGSGQVYYYPFKYKVRDDGQPVTEYYMVLRMAEQYLIRAEARAHQNNLTGAQEDLNIIRNRADLSNTTAATQSELLDAIELERRVELFAEWGHRWFDLKRWNRADAVLGPLKGNNWQSTDVLYPIPNSERDNNPNLSQNTGY